MIQLQPIAEQRQTVRILIVEDESIIARDIQDCLENLGYSVLDIASSGEEAIAKAAELYPDIVLMDIRLRGEMDGIQAAEQIWQQLQIPVIYSTGFSDRSTVERAKLTRPFGYILKPVEERELYVAVETALEQFRNRETLRQREQWFSNVLRDLNDAVIVVDPDCRIVFLNLAASHLTGWQLNEAEGKLVSEVFQVLHAQSRQPLLLPIPEVLQEGILVSLGRDLLLVNRSGSMTPISDSAAPLRDNRGEIIGAVVVFRDLTHQLLQERNLAMRRANLLELQMDELRKLNRLKDDFLSTVSHELRTPLTNMKIAIQMLEIILRQQGALAAEASQANRYLMILRDQCNQEVSLVNDLLDLQRLNAEAYTITPEPIVLQEWLPQSLVSFGDRTERQQQHLQIHIPEDLPPLVSDASALTRILSELVGNACKYTPQGENILVSAQLAPPSTLQIQVCNTGVTIPATELPRLFEQFYRVPSLDQRHEGGTGLGLALVQKLTFYLGGQISVSSANDRTCFTIELPLVRS